MRSLSSLEARTLALAAQGLVRRPDSKPGPQAVRDAIERMGLLQLDFVNIIAPSHYLVLFSRLGNYERASLDQVVYTQRLFTEQWAHEASIVPMRMWPLLEYRRRSHRVRPYGFENQLPKRYLKEVLQEVTRNGAMRSDQLHKPKGAPDRIAGSWYGTIQRVAMEALFGEGRLAVARREPDFARVYDLAERIIPDSLKCSELEQHRQLLLIAARACGVATATDLADYFRMPVTLAKPRIADLVECGDLEMIRVEGWKEQAYLDPRAASDTVEDCEQMRLLSPFDPIVWFRKRTERLFGFEYRLEIFTPPEKRKWGCFVLPVLMNRQLVARVDLKAERNKGVLAVQGAFAEDGADENAIREQLPAELGRLANWLGLERAVIRHPRRTRLLRGTLASYRAV